MSNLPEFNLQSPQHISLLLFGGFLAVEETQSDGFYKNGNPKTKKVKILKNIQGLVKPLKNWKTKKDGIYSTDEKTLQTIVSWFRDDPEAIDTGIAAKAGITVKKIASLMLELRGLNKLIQTYYTSVENLVYPDQCVHPQFNHVATSTGRLSAKNPNVQNQSNDAKVTEHFVSRFQNSCECEYPDEDFFEYKQPQNYCMNCNQAVFEDRTEGVLIGADYSSIEPRCEAQMSEDVMYISDIINNIDPHTKNLSLKLKQPYEDVLARVKSGELEEARKKVKGFTFAVQYGAGDKTIASNSGLTLEEVQELRTQRKLEYPRLHQYYDWLKDLVNKTGEYQDPWGRRYKFKKYPPKFQWQQSDSYSPNEVLNFRTQGFATATIVLSMLGIFWREKALFNRDKYLLINTVHDSVMLDCRKEFEENAKEDLKILETVSIISKMKFNYEFQVPIEIQISSGKNWSEL